MSRIDEIRERVERGMSGPSFFQNAREDVPYLLMRVDRAQRTARTSARLMREAKAEVERLQAKCDRLTSRGIQGMRHEIGRLREAGEAIGSWLSAALDDPKVCDEMKRDIRRWFAALEGE